MSIQVYDGDRTALLPLFRLADEYDSQIESYHRLGTVLAAYEGTTVMGLAQLVDEEGTTELVSLAVRPECQRQGYGSRLIEAAAHHCRTNDVPRLIVGTGAWETDNIVFYLNRGFRIFNVNRGFFTPAKGYAAGRSDQVQLEMSL